MYHKIFHFYIRHLCVFILCDTSCFVLDQTPKFCLMIRGYQLCDADTGGIFGMHLAFVLMRK